MERKPLPIGIDNFESLIENEYYYVDKTLLIKDLLENKASVNLFTRPRRFGKTLNMSMLQYFFEDERHWNTGEKKDNTALFNGMKIMDAGDKYTSQMGQYPVINLSLKSAKQGSLELAFKCLREEISSEFRRHQFIVESDILKDQKEEFMRIARKDEDMSLYVTALKFLSECLYKYFGKKAIILIDEYDVPLENSFFEGFYDKMIKFIRSLFESSLKTNPYLEFAVITGCLRISKESIFTGLNNLEIISILNKSYDEYFGFTDDEVKKICSDYKMESKYETVKEWYNGYVFGDVNVYNPWSVVRYIKDLTFYIDEFPSSYWANTSSNSIVKTLIERADFSVKKEIELLIEGKTIEKPIHEDITYDEIYDSMDNLYNFMYFTGYFKMINQRIDDRTNEKYLELKIPNEEVKYIFRQKILKWFNDKIKVRDLSRMYDAIIGKNPEVFEEELNKLLIETISFNDAYENFYHGFVTGSLMNMHNYIVKSNRECGTGRSDLFIKSVSKRGIAIIIEFKIAKDIDELEKRADDALKQIKDKKYDEELRSEGYKNIVCYGISFYQKDCIIKMKEQ